ncbi:MAG: hypothetical protein GY718_02460 [Lentisphaerae bacterium]|nr:hypothetical protein [Lentisphaerota bacterium]
MQTTIYNTAKSRLETIHIDITEQNSTWFDDVTQADAVYRITDFEGGLLIKKNNYEYPVWIDDVSRVDIDHDRLKAQNILKDSTEH